MVITNDSKLTIGIKFHATGPKTVNVKLIN